jgi:phytoene synthase
VNVDAATAYRVCQRITRSRAANFYYGIRLLPDTKRSALSAVYAFARRVDDIGDDPGDPGGKLARLEELRGRLQDAVAAPSGAVISPSGAVAAPSGAMNGDPVLVAVADARRRFDLPVASLQDLIEGVEMDVRGTRYRTQDELVGYCRRVAGSIGRLSVGVFGSSEPDRAAALGDDLGVAMQLTNILRDVREDRLMGRVYLPEEDLLRWGCTTEDLDRGSPPAVALIIGEAERARSWFARGVGVLSLLDRRSAACVAAMSGIYRRILDRIVRGPEAVFRERVALPAWEKAYVAMASLAGGGAGNRRIEVVG